jgi:hypothetical protein
MTVKYEIIAARNPKWAHPDHNRIDLEVDFADLPEHWLPYTCCPDDVVEHSRELYTRAINNEFGEIQEFEQKDLWYPLDQTFVQVSNESLVQILLEKGILTDEEVDQILVEDTRTVAFAITTSQPGHRVFNGGMF